MSEINRAFFLDRRHVHVWMFEFSAGTDALETLRAQLSEEELERAGRFYFAHLRVSYVIAHGVLRCLLASYLGARPRELQFSYNQQGKPRLAQENCDLRFNLSHSGAMAAVAVAAGCELGVDVEQIRAMEDMFGIARRFFSAAECEDLEAVREMERETAFFDCWTRKEAYIKAIGGGLSIPLDSFRVTLRAGEPPRLLSNREGDAERWNFWELEPGAGYRGAVAYSGPARELIVRRIKADEAPEIWNTSGTLRDAWR
jgi:4'-phosphopantetheinyl transferase